VSTSGSYNYSATASDIMLAAMEDIGKLPAGGTISTADSASILKRLNYIVKQWQGNADMAQGLKLHTRQRVTVFLAKGQSQYLIGPSDSHATTQYGRTTLSAAASANATTISITSNTDTTTYPGTTVTMTAGDYIGIQLSDGTLFWTTISGTPSTTATLVSGITASAIQGAYVYWYTNKAQRFPVCEIAVLRNAQTVDVELPMFKEVAQFERISNKTQQGDPINLLIEPLRTQTRVTTDFLPQDVTKQIRMTVLYPAEDYDLTTDDIAFPQEWFAALEWELALRICPMFNSVWTPEMDKNYQQATSIARELNPKNTVAYFQPNRD
jgi:hypothetical protein